MAMSRVDDDFYRQLGGFYLTTAKIFYHLPDYRHVVQVYVWQDFDLPPDFPNLLKFLRFWRRELDGPLVGLEVASAGMVGPAVIRNAKVELVLPATVH